MQELLSMKEVASTLSVTIETVRRWCRSGKLKHVKLGKKLLRVKKGDLESFIHTGNSNNNP